MSTTAIYEIAPDLFRLSIYVPDFDMQFNHFLVRDEGIGPDSKPDHTFKKLSQSRERSRN